jgi:hypothetical protein
LVLGAKLVSRATIQGPLGTLPSGLEIERRNEDDLTVIEGRDHDRGPLELLVAAIREQYNEEC